MTTKPSPDWELAERLYRAGQLSNVQIAAQIGITEGALRKRAKRDGWAKDLTEKVQKAVKTRLVRDEVRTADAGAAARTEREIIEQAAENAVAVVRSHRKDLTAGQNTLALLFAQLQDAAANRDGELDEMAKQVAAEEGMFAASALARFRKLLSLPTHAGVIRDLSTAMKNFQALERIAWGLNEKDDAPPDYEKQLKELAMGKEPQE
jgi:hypothetical protein